MSNSEHFRVLMITHSVYIRDTRVRRYAEPLADEGHHVDVICLASENGQPQSNHPNIAVYALPMTRTRREGWAHIFEWVYAAFMMFLYCSKLDLRHRYNLIHVHNMPDFLVFCALIPRLRGCPGNLEYSRSDPRTGSVQAASAGKSHSGSHGSLGRKDLDQIQQPCHHGYANFRDDADKQRCAAGKNHRNHECR